MIFLVVCSIFSAEQFDDLRSRVTISSSIERVSSLIFMMGEIKVIADSTAFKQHFLASATALNAARQAAHVGNMTFERAQCYFMSLLYRFILGSGRYMKKRTIPSSAAVYMLDEDHPAEDDPRVDIT